jgi:AcrR family transcriptional regulator
MSPAGGAKRPPGRPRDAAIDAAILRAVSEQLVEHGLRGLSMERVAAVAGVGKATIYRRWSSKEEMVADALAVTLRAPGADGTTVLPDTGSLVSDVREGLQAMFAELRSPAGRARSRIVAEVSSGSALGTVFMRRVVEPRRAQWVALLRRSIDRGELDASVDPEIASDLLIGPPIWIAITRRIDAFDDRAIHGLAQLVCRGLLGPVQPARDT